jgi:hypothetical protein
MLRCVLLSAVLVGLCFWHTPSARLWKEASACAISTTRGGKDASRNE